MPLLGCIGYLACNHVVPSLDARCITHRTNHLTPQATPGVARPNPARPKAVSVTVSYWLLLLLLLLLSLLLLLLCQSLFLIGHYYYYYYYCVSHCFLSAIILSLLLCQSLFLLANNNRSSQRPSRPPGWPDGSGLAVLGLSNAIGFPLSITVPYHCTASILLFDALQRRFCSLHRRGSPKITEFRSSLGLVTAY